MSGGLLFEKCASASDAANLKMIHALVGLEQRWFQRNQITNPHSKVLLAVSV